MRASVAQPHHLPGGLLAADEPTGDLDSRTGVEVMALFQELGRSGITVVLVTHDPDIARLAARVLVVRDGWIVSNRRQAPQTAAPPPQAVELAVAGGLIGTTVGPGAAWRLAASFGWPVLFRPDVVAVAVGFSAAVGVGFGLYSATKAARLDTSKALPLGLPRLGGQLDYAAFLTVNICSNSAGLT